MKDFRFVKIIVLLIKKIENEDKTRYQLLFKLKNKNDDQLK